MTRAKAKTAELPPGVTESAVQAVTLADLKPYPNNTRTHSPEQLEALRGSLREFGWVKPVMILPDMTIIAGHGIVEAAKLEGWTTGKAVIVEGLSDAQVQAYVIADNKLALNSGWDPELLRVQLTELDAKGFSSDFLGFSDDDVSRILDDADTVSMNRTASGAKGGGAGKGEASDHETFTTPMSDLQLGVLRMALKQSKTLYGVKTTGDALIAIVNKWTETLDHE